MAHFVKLSVLDPGHDDVENKTNRKYIPTLINMDMVTHIEPSLIHSLVFTKGYQQPVRVKEQLDEILKLSCISCGSNKTQLNS